MNFVRFLKTAFTQNISEQLLLNFFPGAVLSNVYLFCEKLNTLMTTLLTCEHLCSTANSFIKLSVS